MGASRTFTEAFQRFPDDEQARQEWLAGSDSYDGDGTENDNSNSDLDLIEGDGIGGDNSDETNDSVADNFAEEVATGEIDGHAPDSEVNAALGTDGDPVAVAATEEEVEAAGGVVWETTTTGSDSTGSTGSTTPTTVAAGLGGGGLTGPLGVVLAVLVLGIAYSQMEVST